MKALALTTLMTLTIAQPSFANSWKYVCKGSDKNSTYRFDRGAIIILGKDQAANLLVSFKKEGYKIGAPFVAETLALPNETNNNSPEDVDGLKFKGEYLTITAAMVPATKKDLKTREDSGDANGRGWVSTNFYEADFVITTKYNDSAEADKKTVKLECAEGIAD